MLSLDLIAEKRIEEAIARGELDALPGSGRPLALGDDALVPEDLRLAYRILRNAGYVPPEVQVLADIGRLERLLCDAPDDARRRVLTKIALLRAAAEARRR